MKQTDNDKDDVEMKEIKPNTEAITENERVEETVAEKPPIDLFKSIFLADSSSEDENSEDEESNLTEKQKKSMFGSELSPERSAPLKPWEVKKPENVLRNPNPPKGIFANVDFDRLNSKKVTKPKPIQESTEKLSDVTKTPNERSKHRMSAKDFFDEDPDEKNSNQTFGPSKPVQNI